jgi:hypothetical protein
VIHPYLALAFFQRRLDWPPQATHLDQLLLLPSLIV